MSKLNSCIYPVNPAPASLHGRRPEEIVETFEPLTNDFNECAALSWRVFTHTQAETQVMTPQMPLS